MTSSSKESTNRSKSAANSEADWVKKDTWDLKAFDLDISFRNYTWWLNWICFFGSRDFGQQGFNGVGAKLSRPSSSPAVGMQHSGVPAAMDILQTCIDMWYMQDMTKHPERMAIMLFTTMILLWSQPSCFALYFCASRLESWNLTMSWHVAIGRPARPASSPNLRTSQTPLHPALLQHHVIKCIQMQSLLEVCMRWFDMEDNILPCVFRYFSIFEHQMAPVFQTKWATQCCCI